jgi:hypothetical protein
MNLEITIVSFKQTSESEEELYFCSDRRIESGDYYLNNALQPFIRVQRAFKPVSGERCKKLEASTCRAYNVPEIPLSFVKQYFALEKKDRPVKTYFRIEELTK